jgi:hypothetical protein
MQFIAVHEQLNNDCDVELEEVSSTLTDQESTVALITAT